MRKVLYILTQLNDEDVLWLAANGRRRHYPTGGILIRQGEKSDALIFVLDGEVAVLVDGVGQVAQLGSGEILGEMSFVDKSPTSATVKAILPTQALVIDRDALSNQLAIDHSFASRFYLAVAMYLSVRMRATVRHRQEPVRRGGRAEHGPPRYDPYRRRAFRPHDQGPAWNLSG